MNCINRERERESLNYKLYNNGSIMNNKVFILKKKKFYENKIII